MNKCSKWQKIMTNAYYGELPVEKKNELDKHLSICSNCRQEWENMNQTLDIIEKQTLKDPGKVFWDTYWDILADKINTAPPIRKPEKNSFESRFLFPGWIAQTVGALGLIIVGIFIGRMALPGFDKHHLQIEALQLRTSQYLERSKLIMLGFANFDAASQDIAALNLPVQREKSEFLVRDAVKLKKDLHKNSQDRLYQLVTDLEVILLQIANIENNQGITAVEIVKNGVETRSILFKINLEEIKRISEQKMNKTNQINDRKIT